MLRWKTTLLMSLVIFAPVARAGPPAIPALPEGGVADFGGVLTESDQTRLRLLIAETREETGATVTIVTLNSTGGEDVAHYALRAARTWRLGAVDRDDGLLLVVAIKDRTWSIVAGLGLESLLSKTERDRVGEQVLRPAFRAQHFGAGIFDGACALVSRIAAATGARVPTVTRWEQTQGRPSIVAYSPTDTSPRAVFGVPVANRGSGGGVGAAIVGGALVVGTVLLALILLALANKRPHTTRRREPVMRGSDGVPSAGSRDDGLATMLGATAATTAFIAAERDATAHAGNTSASTPDSGVTGADNGSGGGSFGDSGASSGSW